MTFNNFIQINILALFLPSINIVQIYYIPIVLNLWCLTNWHYFKMTQLKSTKILNTALISWSKILYMRQKYGCPLGLHAKIVIFSDEKKDAIVRKVYFFSRYKLNSSWEKTYVSSPKTGCPTKTPWQWVKIFTFAHYLQAKHAASCPFLLFVNFVICKRN